MAGRYPKPDGEKRNANPPAFGWRDLAPVNPGEAPSLPDWKEWHPATAKWWNELWMLPQAAAWDQTGSTLHDWLELRDDVYTGKTEMARVAGEIRQIRDRHGLNPKAMLQLRWRTAREQVVSVATTEPVETSDRTVPVENATRRGELRELLRAV